MSTMSSDGTKVLAGSLYYAGNRGGAWVYDVLTGVQQTLTPQDYGSTSLRFGSQVALSRDGTKAVVASKDGSNNEGAAYVFRLSDGSWEQVFKLKAEDPQQQANFGAALAFDAGGSILFVGA